MTTRFLGQFFTAGSDLFLVYLTNDGDVVFMGDDTDWDPVKLSECADGVGRFVLEPSERLVLDGFQAIASDIMAEDTDGDAS